MAKLALLAAWFTEDTQGAERDTAQRTIDLTRDLLRKHGFHVVVCEKRDGQEVIELYKKHKPDVVVLEVALHSKDGITVLKELRAFQSDAAVVFFSAYAHEAILRECILAGAKGFVVKDADNMEASMQALVTKLKQAVQ